MQNGCKIPFTGLARQHVNLKSQILSSIDDVLSSGQLMNGKYTTEFEDWLSKKNKSYHAISTHSGTCALEIIAQFYFRVVKEKFKKSDPTVLIPTFTYKATANAFLKAGWKVLLGDVDANGILDMDQAIKKYRYFDLAVPVGLYGQSLKNYYSQDIWTYCSLAGITIIEDAAQHWLSENCTRIGDSSAVSFDPMKNLPNIGNGGAIVTHRYDLYRFAKDQVNNNNSEFNFQTPGSNVRMSEVDCATLLVKSQYLDIWQDRRREIAQFWIDQFKNHSVRCLINDQNIATHACHKFVIDVDLRDHKKSRLEEQGIETKIHYASPLHEMKSYQHLDNPGIISVASSLSRRLLSLPIYPELHDWEIEYIADSVKSIV